MLSSYGRSEQVPTLYQTTNRMHDSCPHVEPDMSNILEEKVFEKLSRAEAVPCSSNFCVKTTYVSISKENVLSKPLITIRIQSNMSFRYLGTRHSAEKKACY